VDAQLPVLTSVARPLRAEHILRDLVVAIELVAGGAGTHATGLVRVRIGPRGT